MHELDRSATGHDVGGGRSARTGGGIARAQREGRAEPLPTGREQVPGHVAEEPVVGADRLVQAVLHPDEVAGKGQESHVVDQGHDRSFRTGGRLSAGVESGSIRGAWE